MLKKLKRQYRPLNLIKVSEGALLHNLKVLEKLSPNQAICPVLKSNAYGHGLELVGKIIDKKSPAYICVDSLYEAQQLKKARIKSPILIMGVTFPDNLKRGLPYTFTAPDLKMAKTLAKLKLKMHLEIDTGMSRMGFSLDKLRSDLKKLKKEGAKIHGVFSHLADADNTKLSFTEKQVEKFEKALKIIKEEGIQPKWTHLGNSAGSINYQKPYLNMARTGIGLYGYCPDPKNKTLSKKLKDLKPAMELWSHLVAVRKIKKGDSVSYNCTYRANKDMTIGTLPLGYYEALPRALSNKGPFLGRICMNHSMIEAPKNAKIGDPVKIFGDLDEIAKWAGTISYELMTRVSASLRRVKVP